MGAAHLGKGIAPLLHVMINPAIKLAGPPVRGTLQGTWRNGGEFSRREIISEGSSLEEGDYPFVECYDKPGHQAGRGTRRSESRQKSLGRQEALRFNPGGNKYLEAKKVFEER